MTNIFTDQLGRVVNLQELPPKRIVSLVPSQTELLHYLGLNEEVVGITKFCIHPSHWFRQKTRIGGTKNFKVEAIKQLKADLVIANKEENTQAGIDALTSLGIPVWVSKINSLGSAFDMIKAVSLILNKQEKGHQLVQQIQNSLQQLPTFTPKRVAYLIWQKPIMVVGGDTYINHLLEQVCGFTNVFSKHNRYPSLSIEQLQEANIDCLLLSSEPFPFKEKHIAWYRQQLPYTQIILVDGEVFSWYGSRLLHLPKYLKQLNQQIG